MIWDSLWSIFIGGIVVGFVCGMIGLAATFFTRGK